MVGKTQAEATAILAKAKFTAIPVPAPSNKPAGVVFKQNPAGGSTAPIGSGITIYVSNGQKPKPKPKPKPSPSHSPSPTPTPTPTLGVRGAGGGPSSTGGIPMWPAAAVLVPVVILPAWRSRGRHRRRARPPA